MMPLVVALSIILGTGIAGFIFFLIRSAVKPKKVAALADLLKQGKTGTVIRTTKQLIAKNQRNVEARYLLGLAYLAEGKPELALMELRTVNQIGQFSGFCQEIPFRKRIAELYSRFEQYEESLKEYLLLIKIEPHAADHYYNAGVLFEERHRSDKAVLYFRKAVELDQNHADAHYRLGLQLYRTKKPLEAKIEFETSLKLRPENYAAYFYMGRLLKENHDYLGALLAFEKAQKDPEQKTRSLVERGGCYMSMGNYDRAISELERAVKLAADDATTETLYGRYFLAVCYERMRMLDRAVEQWEKIYAKKPGFKDVAEKLSQYQEFRTDDRVKDYLTASQEVFQTICRNITVSMGLSVRDIYDIPNGCQIIAVESESKWRNARKMPRLIRFLRVPDIIDESTVRVLHEEMRKLNVPRAIIVTSSSFSRMAHEFAESRPVDLYNKDQLVEMMKTIDIYEGSGNR